MCNDVYTCEWQLIAESQDLRLKKWHDALVEIIELSDIVGYDPYAVGRDIRQIAFDALNGKKEC